MSGQLGSNTAGRIFLADLEVGRFTTNINGEEFSYIDMDGQGDLTYNSEVDAYIGQDLSNMKFYKMQFTLVETIEEVQKYSWKRWQKVGIGSEWTVLYIEGYILVESR